MGCCCYTHVSTENNHLRVAIFGLENSGKTSFVHCLKTLNEMSETTTYISTHGVIAVSIHLNIQTSLDLIIFDCGGCKHQRHIWPHLFNNSDLILFTVDSNDVTCLNDAKEALFDLLTDENLADKPLLIVFTKSDKKKIMNLRHLERTLDLLTIKDRLVHKVLFSSVTLDGLTSISAWFTYFNYCKLHRKEMKIRNSTQTSSSKYRIPSSMNLFTLSKSDTDLDDQSTSNKTHFLTVPKFQKRRRSSISKQKTVTAKSFVTINN